MPVSKNFRVPISEPLKSKEPRAAISGSADKKTAAKNLQQFHSIKDRLC
jgi:hypothetical protein